MRAGNACGRATPTLHSLAAIATARVLHTPAFPEQHSTGLPAIRGSLRACVRVYVYTQARRAGTALGTAEQTARL